MGPRPLPVCLEGIFLRRFPNEDDRTLFLKKRIVDAGQTHLIPGSGVDTRYFLPPSENHRTVGSFTFLYAGRLLRDKGIMDYLEAGRRIAQTEPKARFWVAGELEPDNPVALTAKDLEPYFSHSAFRYWGFLEDIGPVMAQADVFVLPSHREGMPRAVLEAMAMGKPVITSEVPGCKDTVEPGGNGLLIPVEDIHALAVSMQVLMGSDPAALEVMGKQSRRRAVELFDIQAINRLFLHLIEERIKK